MIIVDLRNGILEIASIQKTKILSISNLANVMAVTTAYEEHQSIWKSCRKFIQQDHPLRFGIYRAKWHLAPRFKWTTSFPIHLDLEVTNTCNMRCVMCPHHDPTPEFKASLGFMDFQLFKDVIDEGVSNGMSSIKVNWRGEPLMHPKIADMVKYAKDSGVLEVSMNTNAQLLTEGMAQSLIDAGLDYMICSFDGFSKDTYEKIRIKGKFDKVLENIEGFVALRDRIGLQKPFVRIQLVKLDINADEVEDFIAYWKNRVDLISTQDYTSRGERLGGSLKEPARPIGRRACPQLWQRAIVTWDGNVIMCCRDWESENVVGNLKGKSVKGIWRDKPVEDVRRIHLAKDADEIPVCKTCTYKESYEWSA